MWAWWLFWSWDPVIPNKLAFVMPSGLGAIVGDEWMTEALVYLAHPSAFGSGELNDFGFF